eukprot:CAMPEP_0198286484 /NCGR_PEP_ID=MMETSP1449-20131203/5562_1 /TAXON_ID=420275 /ORGANISM="Attheya septentrionalis, Strain CCMP2084" /LENGTH=892 /DNA_ID=CAMNT_0043984245 /DNA_START=98 /DNA_END=2776 /DNA_ORIENTATION=-
MDRMVGSPFPDIDMQGETGSLAAPSVGFRGPLMSDVDFPDVLSEVGNTPSDQRRDQHHIPETVNIIKSSSSPLVVKRSGDSVLTLDPSSSPAAEASTEEKEEPTKKDDSGPTEASNAQPPSIQPMNPRTARFNSVYLAGTVQAGVSRRGDYPVVPSRMALLVIDIQEYLSKSNKSEMEESERYLYDVSLPPVVSNIEVLAAAVRKQRDAKDSTNSTGCEVIFTFLEALTKDCRDVSMDYKLSGPKLATLPNPEAPATFLEQVQPSKLVGKGDLLIPKTSCSVFNSTNLHFVLKQLHVEQLVVCGQLTDQCVESAVRDGADLGYFVTVVEDACAATSPTNHEKGLAGMQGFARILTTAQILTELEQAKESSATAIVPTSLRPLQFLESPSRNSSTPVSAAHVAHLTSSSERLGTGFVQSVSSWTPPPMAVAEGAAFSLLRSLEYAGVEFLRYMTIDAYNSVRCKAVPLGRLLSDYKKSNSNQLISALNSRISIAQVCMAGLPNFADAMVNGTLLDARNVLAVHPDLGTLRILPYAPKSAVMLGTLHDNMSTGDLSPLCTRGLLIRLLETAKNDFGLAFSVGAELEFCLFRRVGDKFEPVDHSLFASSNTLNEQEKFISDLYAQLKHQDIDVETIHTESASGQLEVVLDYQLDAIKLADNVVLARETIRACAKQHDMIALFLPKINATQAGNGMHLHLSFRDLQSHEPTENAFPHQTIRGAMSLKAESFTEGLLQHLPALLSLSIPTMNSFRRVGQGCWTGHSVGWAIEDKEAPLRVCIDLASGKATNVEMKLSDSTANIYLELAAILASGLDGILCNAKLRPTFVSGSTVGDELNKLPTSLSESLECLRGDAYLLDILGPELSTAYIAVREAEIDNSSDLTLEDEVQIAIQRA